MNRITALAAELDRRQPALARTGWAMAALLTLSLLAMAIDARELRGVSVWVKPAKFAASLGLWALTMAWAWEALAPAARRGRTARLVAAGTIGFIAFEAGWIALRAALGQPSHFAADGLGAFVYGLMGIGAVLGCALAGVFGVLVALRGNPAMDATMRAAVAAGFVVAGVAGAVTGTIISVNQGPYVGGIANDAGALAPFFWSRSGGDLRVAHFIGIHAMQALPLLAWLVARAARPRAWLAAGTLAWVALTGLALGQALAGQPLA
jgi:hypothetical protein